MALVVEGGFADFDPQLRKLAMGCNLMAPSGPTCW